jgi:hypothetical protein
MVDRVLRISDVEAPLAEMLKEFFAATRDRPHGQLHS